MSTPYEQLTAYLQPDETIERICFGTWSTRAWEEGPEKNGIPWEIRGHLLSEDEAFTFLDSKKWSFDNDIGSPWCYAVYVWTNQRVIFVHNYDGSTCLDSVPRNPIPCVPHQIGE